MLPRFFAAADLNGHLRRGLFSASPFCVRFSGAAESRLQLPRDALGVQPLHQLGHWHFEYLEDAEEGA